jgi:MFS family permease
MQIYFSILSVISGMMLMAAGAGMMTVFTPTVLGAAGFGTELIGMVVTANAVGMFCSCFAGGWLIRRIGHIRAFSCYASLVVLAMLALSQVALLPLWLGLRFVTGFCTNSVFMVAQSWLNEAAPADKRGRIMSFFYVSYTVSLGGGAFLLTRIDVSGSLPYLVAAAFSCLAIIPVSATLLPSPDLPERFAVELRLWLRRCPVAIVGAFTSGALAMTLQGVGAIYGGMIGLTSSAIALMMAGTQMGNLVFQWPLGAISDRVDRRGVLLFAAVACFAVCLLLALSPTDWLPLIVLCFAILAGCGESLYTLSTAHANDRAESGDHLSLASTLLVVWASGAAVGPIAATTALSQFGAIGMPLYFATVALAFGVYLLWRLSVREAAEHQPHEVYVPLPQSAMLADEATLYSDDKLVVWDELVNTDEV